MKSLKMFVLLTLAVVPVLFSGGTAFSKKPVVISEPVACVEISGRLVCLLDDPSKGVICSPAVDGTILCSKMK